MQNMQLGNKNLVIMRVLKLTFMSYEDPGIKDPGIEGPEIDFYVNSCFE